MNSFLLHTSFFAVILLLDFPTESSGLIFLFGYFMVWKLRKVLLENTLKLDFRKRFEI